MLGVDNFADQDAADDVKDELNFKLAILNGASKHLNKNWNFTDIISLLLADQGPATVVVPKLKKRMTKMIKDYFLRREEKKKQAFLRAGFQRTRK
jgi:Na+/alanine symporter